MTDILTSIIPTTTVHQRIGAIFPDYIILDNQFRFVSVSQNIVDAVGYSREELINHSFSVLSKTTDVVKLLLEKLRPGYFADEYFELHRKNDSTIVYSVSGFYLGLISDVNGLIVLKLKNQDEISFLHDRLEAKTIELDRFVYVSAHALRGPLATMKGLINLLRTYPSSEDMSFIVDQLDQYAEKLDNKLHKLIYFAESDKGDEAPAELLTLGKIKADLLGIARNSHSGCEVRFSCLNQQDDLAFCNGEVLISLLRNLMMFFCDQPRQDDNELTMDVHANASGSEFVFHARGFLPKDLLKAKFSAMNFSYSEILNYPEFINFYAVKKIIFRLRGDIQFILSDKDDLTVLITVPTLNSTETHSTME
jgi:hypothetical protein